jgi:hypothetical protein
MRFNTGRPGFTGGVEVYTECCSEWWHGLETTVCKTNKSSVQPLVQVYSNGWGLTKYKYTSICQWSARLFSEHARFRTRAHTRACTHPAPRHTRTQSVTHWTVVPPVFVPSAQCVTIPLLGVSIGGRRYAGDVSLADATCAGRCVCFDGVFLYNTHVSTCKHVSTTRFETSDLLANEHGESLI